MVARAPTTVALEIVSIRLYGTLETNAVHQVRKVGVQGSAGYVKTFAKLARACWLRAWDRAKAEQLIPYKWAEGLWDVKGYTVAVTGPGWSDLACSCPAGCNGRICKHAAVVAKAIALGGSPVRGTEKVAAPVVLPA